MIGSASDLLLSSLALRRMEKTAVEKAKQATQQNVEQKVGNAVDKTFWKRRKKAVKGKSKGNSSRTWKAEPHGKNRKNVSGKKQTVAMGYAKKVTLWQVMRLSSTIIWITKNWVSFLRSGNCIVAMQMWQTLTERRPSACIRKTAISSRLYEENRRIIWGYIYRRIWFWCGTKGTYDPIDFRAWFHYTPEDQIDEDVFTLTWIWNDMNGDYEDKCETHLVSWRNSNGEQRTGASCRQSECMEPYCSLVQQTCDESVFERNALSTFRISFLLPRWFTIFSGRGDAGKNKYFYKYPCCQRRGSTLRPCDERRKIHHVWYHFWCRQVNYQAGIVGWNQRITQMMKDNPGLKFSVEGIPIQPEYQFQSDFERRGTVKRL